MTANPGGEREARPSLVGLASGTFAGTLVGVIVMFANEVLAARFLGLEAYGLYAIGIMVARVGEMICTLGLRAGVLHFIPIYRNEGDRQGLASVIRAALVMPLIAAAAYIAAAWLGAPLIGGLAFDAAVPYISLLVLAVPFLSLSDILGNMTRGFGYARYYVLTRHVAPPLVYLGLIAVLYATDAPAIAIAPAFVAAQLAGFLVGLACVARVAGPVLRSTKPRFIHLRLYAYSWPILINTAIYAVVAWTPVFVLGAMASAAAAGLYRAAMQITIVFETIGVAFNAASAHIYPVAIRQQLRVELEATYAKIARMVSLLAIPAFVVISLAAADILGLLGAAFRSAALPMVILAAGQLVFCLSANAGFLLVVGGAPKRETTSAACAATANLVLNLLLVPRFGIAGAATATALALVLFAALRLAQARKAMQVHVLHWRSLRTLVLSLLAGGIAAALGRAVETSALNAGASLAARLAVAVVLLALVLWSLDLDRGERALLRRAAAARLASRRSA